MFGNKELKAENERLKDWIQELSRMSEEKTFGVMTVEVPMTASKEMIDKHLLMVQERMDADMKRLGIDLDWVIMPSVVKTVQTITVEVKKEVKP